MILSSTRVVLCVNKASTSLTDGVQTDKVCDNTCYNQFGVHFCDAPFQVLEQKRSLPVRKQQGFPYSRVGKSRIGLCDGHLQKLVLRISPIGVPGALLAEVSAASLTAPGHSLVGRITRTADPGLLCKPRKEKSHPDWDDFFFSGCGGRTRTYDLRVMRAFKAKTAFPETPSSGDLGSSVFLRFIT